MMAWETLATTVKQLRIRIRQTPTPMELVTSAITASRGLTRIRAIATMMEWAPDEPLSAVVLTPAAFAGLKAAERSKVFAILQSATRDGGVHLVDTLIQNHAEPSLSELKRNYKGWTISVVDKGTSARSFVARKEVA